MEKDALEGLRTLVSCEKQIPTRDGRWFMVRIVPYRTLANVIDGRVATFINLTELKSLEACRMPPAEAAKISRNENRSHPDCGPDGHAEAMA
ncbi:PAS domain-containing protein [Pseudoduganella sp. UC29_106]|uniref:PAS domain-containing protein n=1 Tax=Pseudoduganella sp. UC29_106 TaxID=3374553 RepID=UPI0037568778